MQASIPNRQKIEQFHTLSQNVERLRALRCELNRLEKDRMKYANRNDLNLEPLEKGVLKIKAEMFDIASKVL